MSRVAHVIGNGDQAQLFKPAPGVKITCNLPPMAIDKVYATCVVDFKMMMAITEGSVNISMYDWILGYRPRKWMEMRPDFYMKVAKHIKQFYTVKPDYANNYTDFNCGHMAVHYTANVLKADEIHMYGFDSLFDFNLRSVTDLYLNSDRSNQNVARLTNNWRPIWEGMWKEFSDRHFVLHHSHKNCKIPLPDNVEIKVHGNG